MTSSDLILYLILQNKLQIKQLNKNSMQMITDNIEIAKLYAGNQFHFSLLKSDLLNDSVNNLLKLLTDRKLLYIAEDEEENFFQYMYIIEYSKESQYDVIQDFTSKNDDFTFPSILIAHQGEKFHGQNNRKWEAIEGNLHLTLFFNPNIEISNSSSTSFNIISSVSVIEALDEIFGLENLSKTKWINDVLIDGAKVAGCIAQSQMQANLIQNIILGIGLNVEQSPELQNSLIVRNTTNLRKYQENSKECNLEIVLKLLLEKIKKNYFQILKDDIDEMLDLYKQRSAVTGKKVVIYPDINENDRIKVGAVIKIGEHLELYLDNESEPVSAGRLVVLD